MAKLEIPQPTVNGVLMMMRLVVRTAIRLVVQIVIMTS